MDEVKTDKPEKEEPEKKEEDTRNKVSGSSKTLKNQKDFGVSEEEVKIEEKEKPEKEEETEQRTDVKNILILVGFIVVVLVLALGGSSLFKQFSPTGEVISIDQLHRMNAQGELDQDEGYVYNGYSFVEYDGLWWTMKKIQGRLVKIPLHFGPKELESIEIEGELDPQFNIGEEIYLAIDPTVTNKFYTLALSELSFNMAKGISRTPIGSCTKESPDCENRTIISCENTQGKPVVELALGGEPRVELKGTCIKISGEEYGLVRAVNRVLYKWYGMMN